MCTGAELFLIGSTVVSAGTQIAQGQQQKKFADFQAAQANADAQAEREAGVVAANKTRKQGKYAQAEAAAALAGSGVEVTAGTPIRIDQQIARNVEEDALQEILFGTRKGERLDQEAVGLRASGKNAARNSLFGAAGSILSAGATMNSPGWKRVAKEQAPAPVEDRYVVGIR